MTTRKPFSPALMIVLGLHAIVFQVLLGTVIVEFSHPSNILLAFALGGPIGASIVQHRLLLRIVAVVILSSVVLVPGFRVQSTTLTPFLVEGQGLSRGESSNWEGQTIADKRCRVATEFAFSEPLIRGRRGRRYGERTIAPLVSVDWTRDQDVDAWIVAEQLDSGAKLDWDPGNWNEETCQLVRRVGQQVPGSQAAARRAAKEHGLTMGETIEIAMLVRSVEDTRQKQIDYLVDAALLASALWIVAVITDSRSITFFSRRERSSPPQN